MCEIALRIFTVWIHCSPYADQVWSAISLSSVLHCDYLVDPVQIEEIKVMCTTEEDFQLYVDAARNLYDQASLVGQSMVANFMQPELVLGLGQNQ